MTTPGWASISGAAWATTAVTVNGSATDRKGEFFHREISVANSGGPVWTSISVEPELASGTPTDLLHPRSTQSYTYDLDGNLTFDGIWTYEWDAENRLKTMTMEESIAYPTNSFRKKLDFTYDYMGRRASKTVRTWNGSSFGNPVTTRFVYDGWNLIAILNSQSSIVQSFLWGQDLSGTMDEAGGVGG